MSPFQALQIPIQLSFSRRVSLALEVLDAVTLQRVNQGVTVIAEGFRGKPVQNASGIFVWIGEDITQLRSITVDTGRLPLEGALLSATSVKQPLTTIELSPRLDYPFTAGVTGLRGTLVESKVLASTLTEPVSKAMVNLIWLNEDGAWVYSPIVSTTDSSGDFVSIVRFPLSRRPMVASDGTITVRLQIIRGGWKARTSKALKLKSSAVANPTTIEPLIFVWNELLP